MQDPESGTLTSLDSLTDPKRKGKEHWQTYEVGEKVRFRGWWWEITEITGEGIEVKVSHKASILERFDDIALLERELKQLKQKRSQ